MTRSRHLPPAVLHGSWALFWSLLLAVGLLLLFRSSWSLPHVLAAWLVGTNLTAFGYYGYDKGQAQAGGRRVPEAVLHGIALVGGSPGAYLAMRLFRHKTVKGPFRILFWAIVVLQLLLIAYLVFILVLHRG